MSRRTLSVLATLAVVPFAVTLAGCASASPGSGGESSAANETVRIGVVNDGDAQWAPFVAAAAAEDISVELVNFGSYEQPNPALAEGELDLNQFQHIVYLAEYNEASGNDLTPIGSTAIYPLGLYSTKFDDVKSIPKNETVAVPDDASNQARALLVLQSAGLVELKSGGTIFSDLADIDTDKSKVKVTALEAALIPTSLPDVAAAIVNNDFVTDAGLTFDDALAQDDPEDANALPYVNIFAAKAEDADNETYLTLVEIFQTDADVQAGLQESSGNVAAAVQVPAEDLVDSLAKVQKDTRAQG